MDDVDNGSPKRSANIRKPSSRLANTCPPLGRPQAIWRRFPKSSCGVGRTGNWRLKTCQYVKPFRRCSNLRPIVHEWVDCALSTTPRVEKTKSLSQQTPQSI